MTKKDKKLKDMKLEAHQEMIDDLIKTVEEMRDKITILETTIYESINVMVNISTNFELKEHDLRACLGVSIGNLFYGLEQIKDEE